MSDDIDSLLSSRANTDDGDIDSLLSDRANTDLSASAKATLNTNQTPWYRRALTTGFTDPFVGAGQLMQHLTPDAAMNVVRTSAASIAGAIPGMGSYGKEPGQMGMRDVIDSIAAPASTADVDKAVSEREQAYQADRAAAGRTGFDWTRTGGTLLNPVTWLAPETKGAGLLASVANGAKQGVFQSLMQPVTQQGNFALNKGIQGGIGAAVGGALGGAFNILAKPFTWGIDKIRQTFGANAEGQAAAKQMTDGILNTAGADPQKMDPRLYSSIQQEVQDSLKAGVDPNPRVMVNRADAAALPVPIDLMRGQASRDPMQFSWEINTGKLRDAGEPIAERVTTQNRQLIDNLNMMGAQNAPTPIDASQKIIDHIGQLDETLKSRVSNAYNAVRDSAGRPALMDHVNFVNTANDALDHAQLQPYLPAEVRNQLNDIASGKLPLTVNVAQQLDKVWGAAQRGAGNEPQKLAIGQLRDALNKAPVSDALGESSMQAYKAAREMARQRFALMDSNPAYKAVVDSVEPDKFFQKYIQGADVADISKLKTLIGGDNTKMLQDTLVGNLKRIALNKASDENGTFSQSAYNRVLQDPVQGPRIQELFKDAPDVLENLYRVGRVAENIQLFPKGHGVNTSNTAPTAANILRDVAKSEGGNFLWSLVPGGKAIRHLSEEAIVQNETRKAVNSALNPGVTTQPIKKVTPPATRKLSDLLARGAAAGAISEAQE